MKVLNKRTDVISPDGEKELALEYKKWEEATMKAEQALEKEADEHNSQAISEAYFRGRADRQTILEAEHKEEIEQTIKDDADRCAGYMEALRTEHKEQVTQAVNAAIITYKSTREALMKEKVRKIFEEIEDKVYYIDNRSYIALKPNATKNWQALKKEVNKW